MYCFHGFDRECKINILCIKVSKQFLVQFTVRLTWKCLYLVSNKFLYALNLFSKVTTERCIVSMVKHSNALILFPKTLIHHHSCDSLLNFRICKLINYT